MPHSNRELIKICTRFYKRDNDTLREICTTQNIEYSLLVREIIRQYCSVARAEAVSKIDQTVKPISSLDPIEVQFEGQQNV